MMKIRSDQVDALQQQEQGNKTKKVKGASFGEFLDQEVEQTQASASQTATSVPGLQAINPLLNLNMVENVQSVENDTQQLTGKVEGVLGRLDDYAGQLSSSGESSLKDAYSSLEGLQSDVQEIRKNWPDMSQKNPELDAIVNEVEVMAVTEQMKFNRGDYI
jgi:hypothetical protein